jgi:hypothetical protein
MRTISRVPLATIKRIQIKEVVEPSSSQTD